MTEPILNQLLVVRGVDQLVCNRSAASIILQLAPGTIEEELVDGKLTLLKARNQTSLITRDYEYHIVAVSNSYSNE